MGAGLARRLRGALLRRGLGFERRVDPLAQLLAGLEVRHVLLRHLHLLARLGIAAGARRAVVEAEAAETADLDAVAGEQRVGHGVENHLDGVLGILRHQLRVALREARNELRLGHFSGVLPLSSLARSNAPRLVAPALAAAFSVRICFIAAVSSDWSLALTDRLIERFLRSTLMIIAFTVSPSLSTLDRSSMRSRENSDARR